MKEKESDKEKIDRVELLAANGSSLVGKLIDHLAKIASAPTSGIAAPFPGRVSGGLAGWLARKIFKK